MSSDEVWDTFEDLTINFELWDDFGPRKPPPTQVASQVPKAYTILNDPSGDDLVKIQFEMDMILQTQMKATSSQVNSVVSSPQCTNCGIIGHQEEEWNHIFGDTERAEVHQVGTNSQGKSIGDTFAYNLFYQPTPKPYNNYAP